MFMHRNQTVEFVEKQRAEWLNFDKGEFTVMEMIDVLDSLVDDSDPDNDLPNSIHDFQTAERIREKWPDHDWFHLVGLLHDCGKVLACHEVARDKVLPQWAVVGDTFVVGCAPSDDISSLGGTLLRATQTSCILSMGHIMACMSLAVVSQT